MPDSLLGLLIGTAALAILYVVMSWFARAEKRVKDRQWIDRIYYPTRGKRAAPQDLSRRPAPHAENGVEPLPLASKALPRRRDCLGDGQQIASGLSQEE